MAISCPTCHTENSDDSKFCHGCATPLTSLAPDSERSTTTAGTPLRELAPGSTFAGRYRIIEELGRGGMGRVYKAFDAKLGEKTALKLVRPEIGCDSATLERFSNEIRLARQITHRNVCRVYDLGDAEGTPYITMEYVSGEDLKSVLRMMGGLSPAQTASVGRQVASGLAEAHRVGIVHRDLKPQNVMIDRDGTARVMDFGIACSAATRGLTGRGVMIGTPEYMSPEQAEGKAVDGRADIYSLGVMLFEMATGALPFTGTSSLAVAMKHKTESPPDPTTVNPRVPPPLSRVILKCLEKDPAARYQSADELEAALDESARALPTPVTVLPPGGQTPSGPAATAAARSVPRLLAVGGAVVLVLVIAGVAWQIRSREAAVPVSGTSTVSTAQRVPNSIAVVAFENDSGDVRFDHLRKAIPNLIVTALENSGRFEVVTWERMRDVLKQLGRGDTDLVGADAGLEVCRHDGIALIVIGSFTKAGDTFAIDVKVLDARSRALLKSVTARGVGENSILLTQIDEIGRGISSGSVVAGPQSLAVATAPAGPLGDSQIANVTTTSMEAYTAYLRGREASDRLEVAAAVEAFKEAVRLDPAFASAYSEMAWAHWNSSDFKARDEAIELAMQHASRATPRERLLIQSRYAWSRGDRDTAVARLKELVSRYPQDKEAYYSLGSLSRQDPPEQIRWLERAVALDPTYGFALNSLGFAYFRVGRPDRAREYLERYVAAYPDDANPHDSLGILDLMLGRLDDADRELQRARVLSPGFGSEMALAVTAALREDYAAALGWLDRLEQSAKSDGIRADAEGLRAVLLHLTGRTVTARAALRAYSELSTRLGNGARATLLAGWLAYDSGSWNEARTSLQRGRADARRAASRTMEAGYAVALATVNLAQRGSAPPGSELSQLRAALAAIPDSEGLLALNLRRLEAAESMARGRVDEAITLLEPAWPGPVPTLFTSAATVPRWISYSCPLQQDELARFYVHKRDDERAIAQYRVLTAIGPAHTNRRFVHPLYHFRLAEVYELAGRNAEAIAEYERFLELWRGADSTRPEMITARERLTAIRRART